MGEKLSKVARADLQAFGRAVQEARVLRGWTLDQLGSAALAREDAKGFLSKIENGTKPITALTAGKLCRALDLPKEVLAPFLANTNPSDEDVTDELRANYGTLPQSLNHLAEQSHPHLAALARRFGMTDTDNVTDTALRAFLDQKAEEFIAYQAQIEAIDTRTAGLGNLKAAAKDAADRLAFDEVEELLSRVDQVETEIAAETKELRATNALMRGRPDEAFAHFTAAAESFRALDPLEPAQRRVGYFEPLWQHGLRYGGAGLTLSERMIRAALADLTREGQPFLWAEAQNRLAVALQDQAIRTEGAAGTDLLTQAVAAFDTALQVYTRADHPGDWAMTMQNKGNALATQGSRTEGAAGTDLLAQAVGAYHTALQVFTRADHPVDWAMTMQNKAIALQTQGSRTEGAAGTDLLAQAVAAYDAALQVRSRADHPDHWAMTMQNKANALQNHGSRIKSAAGTDLLAQAVAADDAVLQVYTRADHPVQWATTMQNKGNALAYQAIRTEGAAGIVLLTQAIATYNEALQVRTRADHPVDWAMTRENMAIAELATAEHPACADPAPHLHAALGHVEAALTVYDPEHMGFYHTKATRLRDYILAALNALPPST